MIKPSCMRVGKIRDKKRDKNVYILPSHGVVDFRSRSRKHGMEFAV